MYVRIFGFQRFVWCPKWTPASMSERRGNGMSRSCGRPWAVVSVDWVIVALPFGWASALRPCQRRRGGAPGNGLRWRTCGMVEWGDGRYVSVAKMQAPACLLALATSVLGPAICVGCLGCGPARPPPNLPPPEYEEDTTT